MSSAPSAQLRTGAGTHNHRRSLQKKASPRVPKEKPRRMGLRFRGDDGRKNLPHPCRHHAFPFVMSRASQNSGASEMADPVQVVTPHLVVNDANAALEFYKRALGASEVMRMPAQDGKRLLHSEIQVRGPGTFVMDDFPAHRGSPCGAA